MKCLPSSRKGQRAMNISTMGVVAISLLIAAVILGLGGTILEKIQDTQSDDTGITSNNQSFTVAANNSETAFAQARVNTGSVIMYGNGSVMTLGTNYTVSGSGVKVFVDSDGDVLADLVDVHFNMTYDYQIGSIAFNGSNFGKTGVLTLAEFIPTIAIVAVAAIVIGILLVFFGRRKGT